MVARREPDTSSSKPNINTSTAIEQVNTSMNTQSRNDPDAEAFLELSIKNLNKVAGEPTRLGLFSTAVKEKGLLANPAQMDDPIFGVLDEVAFHLKSTDDDPDYHDQYLDLLKRVPQPSGVADWSALFEDINKNIERSVAKDKDAVRKFRSEKKAYLTDMADRRRELLEARGPSQGVDLKALGGKFGKNAKGLNVDARAPGGGVRAFAGYVEAGDDFGGVNRAIYTAPRPSGSGTD